MEQGKTLGKKISFTTIIKDEIALTTFESDEELKSLISALTRINGSINIRSNNLVLSIRTDNRKIVNLIFNGFKRLYSCIPRIIVSQRMNFKKEKFMIVEISRNVKEICSDLQIYNELSGYQSLPSRSLLSNYELRRSYLMGSFLATGSINSPYQSDYHLEISFNQEDYAKLVAKLFEKFDINPRIVKRRNSFIVYLKKSEQISDFLRVVKAINGLMEFEDQRITRDQKNSMNRVSNCVIANELKSLATGKAQSELIEVIENKMGIKNLKEGLKEIAMIRYENPEYTLSDIAEEYEQITGKMISKSGVNHRMKKIEEIANFLKVGTFKNE